MAEFSSQSIVSLLIVATVASMIFLPTLDYDIVPLKDRIKYSFFIMVYGTMITYSLNCMIVGGGSCYTWSWILTILCAVVPALIGVMYIYDARSVQNTYEKIKFLMDTSTPVADADADADVDADDTDDTTV